MAAESVDAPQRPDIIPLPDRFFQDALPALDELEQLKQILHLLAALGKKDSDQRCLTYADLLDDTDLMTALSPGEGESSDGLDAALTGAIDCGALLETVIEREDEALRCFTLNDAGGRQIQERMQAGQWQPGDISEAAGSTPNVFQIYEDNIGTLTPVIVDAIREAEAQYPAELIAEAIGYAAKRNIHNWRYISKVLENRSREGRGREKTGRALERRKQYIAGEWQDRIRS